MTATSTPAPVEPTSTSGEVADGTWSLVTRAPETSIVIRAMNEERWLPEVLEAIARQTYRDYEIVLVDSGSVDRTREIAAAHGTKIVRLRPEDFTFGHSLNVGIRHSRGAFIAIVSAHAIPSDATWLERLVTPLRDRGTAMVFGGQRGHAVSKFSEARDFERIFPDRAQVLDDEHYFVNNANSAIRRDLWEQHPFDEGLPGLEDIEWAKHWLEGHGLAIRYDPMACIAHVHTESWAQVRHRFHREGIAGRWVAVRIVRHIPMEILREVGWCAADLWLAARAGRLAALTREIVRYRYHKAAGIVQGILDSRTLDNPSLRAEIFCHTSFPAVVIRGPHHAALEQRSIPTLKPGEVLVRVAYVGVCATDLEVFEGRLGCYASGAAQYPIVPGHEVSGTVVSVGKKVTTLHEGDRVVVESIQGCGACDACRQDGAISCRERSELGVMGLDGGYGSYVVTHARYARLVPPPLTLAQAALVEPLAVVLKGLRKLGAGPNAPSKRCAVIGAGTIGHLAARVLAQRGHSVTVFDQEPGRLAYLAGAAATSTTLEGLNAFDWLVEATGSQVALTAALEQSRAGASVLLLGLPYAQQPFSFESIVELDKTVVGSVGSTGADFEAALVTLPRLNTHPFLDTMYPLDDYQHAWEGFRSRAHLKVMLRLDATAA